MQDEINAAIEKALAALQNNDAPEAASVLELALRLNPEAGVAKTLQAAKRFTQAGQIEKAKARLVALNYQINKE
jgi:thioredoxin-like negative regulator of GroEL